MLPTKFPKIPQAASAEQETALRVASALNIDPSKVRSAILLVRTGRTDLLGAVIAGDLDLCRALQLARVRGARP